MKFNFKKKSKKGKDVIDETSELLSTNITSDFDSNLLDLISPLDVDYRRKYIEYGEHYGEIYGVIRYPSSPDYGWLSKITNIPNTVVSITFRPINSSNYIDVLSNQYREADIDEQNAKEYKVRADAANKKLNIEKSMNALQSGEETLGLTTTLIMTNPTSYEMINKYSRKVISTLNTLFCKYKLLSPKYLLAEGHKAISPYHTVSKDIEDVFGCPVPLSTVFGGIPFATNGYHDKYGNYFAKDVTGGVVMLDLWKRDEHRTNSNIIAFGIPGMGKSTTLKDIALTQYMMGVKIIFIDPNREYRTLTNILNRNENGWIDASGNAGGHVNPLQIRSIPADAENEEDEDKLINDSNILGPLALHMKNLEIFIRLRFRDSFNDYHMAIFNREIIEVYNKFNIDWNTNVDDFKNEDFPVFSDLGAHLDIKINEGNINDFELPIYHQLRLLLEDIINGSDQFLWNRHTDINTNSRCICLDTQSLQNNSDTVRSTQYFNLLSWIWEELTRNRNEKILIFCDEAYVMVDPKVPQSLKFLRNASKQSRKYEGGLAVITHAIEDFLSPEVKRLAQPILDTPNIKIFMGTDGKNLEDTKNIYKLNDAEVDLLASQKRRHALLMIGAKRMHVRFDIAPYKFEYFGKEGGR
jgi:hypothetical protein